MTKVEYLLIEENIIKNIQKELDTTRFCAEELFKYLDEMTERKGLVTREHYKNRLVFIIKAIIIEGIERNHVETMGSINRIFNSHEED